MHRYVKRSATVAALLTLACTGDGAAPAYSTTDSAGVTLATNDVAEAPVFARLSRPADLRLGSEDDPATLFDRIAGVASLAGERIVVADGGSAEARVFEAGGQHAFTVGREGGGPGEIRHLAWVSAVRDGAEILLWDAGSVRGQRFGADGTLLGATPILSSPDHPLVYAVGTRGEDLVVMGGPPRLRLDGDGRLWQWTDYLLFSLEGEVLDTIGSFPTLECDPANRAVCNPLEGRSGGTHAWSGDHLFQVIVDRPELKVFDFGGRLLTRAELRLHDGASAEVASGPGTAQGDAARDPSSPAILDHVLADSAGRAWVRRAGTGTWYVLEPETGRLLGSVAVPVSFRPMEIGEDYLLGVERDSLDVPTVVRYGLEADERVDLASDTVLVLASRAVDLTGDGEVEVLELVGVGESVDSLDVTLDISSAGRTIYRQALRPITRTIGFDAGKRTLAAAEHRQRLDELGRFIFADAKFRTPDEFIARLEEGAPRHVALIPHVIGRERRDAVGDAAVSGEEIWQDMRRRGSVVFEFSPGGDGVTAIAWSEVDQRFYRLWECC